MESPSPPQEMPESVKPEPQTEVAESKPSLKGISGLTNIGNTCYGNAVIQALRHQVDFTLFLLQGNHKPLLKKKEASDRTRMLESYAELVQQLWSAEGSVIKTRNFWQAMLPVAIKNGFEQFRVPIAHDAHEFLMLLLDTFHEALAEEVTMTIRTPSNTNTKGALEFWKSSFEKKYSPLVELVFGIQQKCVKCTGCNTDNISWEIMNASELCVQKSDKPVELLDLMASIYTKGDSDIIDDYACEKCKPLRPKATVTRSLWRLGNWVVIVLKRNENNGRRINTVVNIPLTTTFTPMFHPTSEEPSKEDTFELFSTIHHHGGANGGHYTSHAKHSVTGKWIRYDDENAYNAPEPRLDQSTYIVMYRRKT